MKGNAAQNMARQEALKDKVTELRKQGLTRQEAQKQVENWLSSKAVLHNPDQIAGGNPLNIGGLGDKGINSSLGIQWRYRIDLIDEKIQMLLTNSQIKN